MSNSQFYKMPLREGIFSLAILVCSHALLHADEVDPKTHFPSEFPAVSLSLEEPSETRPAGTPDVLSFGT